MLFNDYDGLLHTHAGAEVLGSITGIIYINQIYP